jgi:hypothetical protein
MASDVSLTTASRSQWRPNGLIKLQGYGTTEYQFFFAIWVNSRPALIVDAPPG